jgi:hypothetical protein
LQLNARGVSKTGCPRLFGQPKLKTIFLRVPYSEWGLVRDGKKTEFRGSLQQCSQLWNAVPPLPVVAYAIFPTRGHRTSLMVLEKTWREPLEAITPQSLAREGQPDFAHFRRYWMAREHQTFKARKKVWVYRIRPWEPGDIEEQGQRLLERLYGEFLDP